MRSVLFYKLIDLWGQVAALALPWLFFALMPGWGRVVQLDHIMLAYYVIGTLQVASCLINSYKLPVMYKAKSRRWYNKSLMVLVVLMPACYMLKVLLFGLVVLLYASPVLAVWYLGITIAELGKMAKPIPLIDTEITETDV